MTLSFFTQKAPSSSTAQFNGEDLILKLKTLAAFIQTETNRDLLYANGSQGGHINFEALSNFSNNQLNHFNTTNQAHLNLMAFATSAYEEKLKQLQTIDFKIALSFTIGAAALAFSFLTFGFSGLIAASAFSYFGYQLAKREQARAAYQQAQADVTNVYIWAMNDTESILSNDGNAMRKQHTNQEDAEYARYIQSYLDPTVKNMHKVVNPMLSDQDIWVYTRNDLDKAITVDRNNCNADAINNQTTTKLQLSLSYLLYGQDQGSPTQIAKGLGVMFGQTLMNIGISIKDGVLSMIGMSEKEVVEKVVAIGLN